jgi:hypothetical protein
VDGIFHTAPFSSKSRWPADLPFFPTEFLNAFIEPMHNQCILSLILHILVILRMTKIAVEQRNCITVDIYIAEHCPICKYAFDVAAMIQQEFPVVAVRLIKIDELNVVIPESVFATPTYLLNGDRWSLGNPSLDRVREVLAQALNG